MLECDLAPDFYHWSEPIARKPHRCCECRAPIEKGEKHFHARGKLDGEISVYRQHLLCMEACMTIRDEFQGGECIPFGALMDWMHEYKFDLREDRHKEPVKKLRGLMARIRWRERRSARITH